MQISKTENGKTEKSLPKVFGKTGKTLVAYSCPKLVEFRAAKTKAMHITGIRPAYSKKYL